MLKAAKQTSCGAVDAVEAARTLDAAVDASPSGNAGRTLAVGGAGRQAVLAASNCNELK